MTEATHADRAQTEARLIAAFEKQPEYSLAWEAYQHAQFSWDRGVLDWVETMASSDSFADLYGMSGLMIDADEFALGPGSHLGETLSVWCKFVDDPEAPEPHCADLVAQLYWFAMKKVTLEIVEQSDVDLKTIGPN